MIGEVMGQSEEEAHSDEEDGPRGEERRYDGAVAYTRREFMDCYGGLDEWHAATKSRTPDVADYGDEDEDGFDRGYEAEDRYLAASAGKVRAAPRHGRAKRPG